MHIHLCLGEVVSEQRIEHTVEIGTLLIIERRMPMLVQIPIRKQHQLAL